MSTADSSTYKVCKSLNGPIVLFPKSMAIQALELGESNKESTPAGCPRLATEIIHPSPRYSSIDAVRGIAACIIVLHHLTLYAPQSALVDSVASAITVPLFNYGSYVVQFFLVIGGFTLAINMPETEIDWKRCVRSVLNRYLRLSIPYLASLTVLILVWLAFGHAMRQPLMESLSLGQLVTHLFFLQDVFGYGNLSAGTWYLCIDIQYAVGCTVLWTALSYGIMRFKVNVNLTTTGAWILMLLGMVSAWYWNRNPNNEPYVCFFMGTLVLGSVVGWSIKDHVSKQAVATYTAMLLASLSIDFRPRLLVAIATAALIYLCIGRLSRVKIPKLLQWFGKVSYCLFLVHYSICALTLHLLDTWIGESPLRACVSMLLAFANSAVAAWVLHLCVELPSQKWVRQKLQLGPKRETLIQSKDFSMPARSSTSPTPESSKQPFAGVL